MTGRSDFPPRELLADIAEKQFPPLSLAMALAYLLPAFAAKVQPSMTMIGNVVLTAGIVAFLFKLGPRC